MGCSERQQKACSTRPTDPDSVLSATPIGPVQLSGLVACAILGIHHRGFAMHLNIFIVPPLIALLSGIAILIWHSSSTGIGFTGRRRSKSCSPSSMAKSPCSFLPPYAPQLNPDELVWGQIKQCVGKQLIKSTADLKARVMAALCSLQKLPEKIRGFFQAPSCQYAAC